MHVTPEDFRRLLATAAVYLVTYIAVAYAIAVLIAVTLKGFRTRFALQSSLVISGIVSVLYLSALMLDWRYLPRHKPDGKAEILWMIMLDAGGLHGETGGVLQAPAGAPAAGALAWRPDGVVRLRRGRRITTRFGRKPTRRCRNTHGNAKNKCVPVSNRCFPRRSLPTPCKKPSRRTCRPFKAWGCRPKRRCRP